MSDKPVRFAEGNSWVHLLEQAGGDGPIEWQFISLSRLNMFE